MFGLDNVAVKARGFAARHPEHAFGAVVEATHWSSSGLAVLAHRDPLYRQSARSTNLRSVRRAVMAARPLFLQGRRTRDGPTGSLPSAHVLSRRAIAARQTVIRSGTDIEGVVSTAALFTGVLHATFADAPDLARGIDDGVTAVGLDRRAQLARRTVRRVRVP